MITKAIKVQQIDVRRETWSRDCEARMNQRGLHESQIGLNHSVFTLDRRTWFDPDLIRAPPPSRPARYDAACAELGSGGVHSIKDIFKDQRTAYASKKVNRLPQARKIPIPPLIRLGG